MDGFAEGNAKRFPGLAMTTSEAFGPDQRVEEVQREDEPYGQTNQRFEHGEFLTSGRRPWRKAP